MKLNYEVPLVKTVIIRNKETICQVSGGTFTADRGESGQGYTFDTDDPDYD